MAEGWTQTGIDGDTLTLAPDLVDKAKSDLTAHSEPYAVSFTKADRD